LSSIEGQYLGPILLIFPEYIGDLSKFALISLCVSSVVFVIQQFEQEGLSRRMEALEIPKACGGSHLGRTSRVGAHPDLSHGAAIEVADAQKIGDQGRMSPLVIFDGI